MSIQTELIADLTGQIPPSDHVVGGVGKNSDLIICALLKNSNNTKNYDRQIAAGALDYEIYHLEDERLNKVVLNQIDLTIHHIQSTSMGYLVVCARCAYRENNIDKNAIHIDREGKEIARFTLGDGIKHIRVIQNDRICVAYFDEGVYGNFGWSPPIGRHGFITFDLEGNEISHFDYLKANGNMIDDLYAMNISSERDAWLYYYSDFPFVNIKDNRYELWETDFSGGNAFAIYKDKVLLCGDYRKNNIARIIKLEKNGQATIKKETHFINPNGKPLEIWQACGIGHQLYLFEDDKLYRTTAWYR